MKALNKYVNEKLVLNKDTFKDKFIKEKEFSKEFNIPFDISKELFRKYYVNSEEFFGVKGSGWCCTPLELLYMIAAMLIDDNLIYRYYKEIDLTTYPGKNDPFDYSWFEEDNDPNVMKEVRIWIYKNELEFSMLYDIILKYDSPTDPEEVFDKFLKIFDK